MIMKDVTNKNGNESIMDLNAKIDCKVNDYVWLCNQFGFKMRGNALRHWMDKILSNQTNHSILKVLDILLNASDLKDSKWNDLSLFSKHIFFLKIYIVTI